MPTAKTHPTDASVDDYLAAVPGDRRRADAFVIDTMMRRLTGQEPVMWGPSIVGYGQSPSGWPEAAFSPRKAESVVYISVEFPERDGLLARLGPHRVGKSCLYLRRLDLVDLAVLEQLIRHSLDLARAGDTC